MAKLDSKARRELPKTNFAFVQQGKEPLEDAAHVRNAISRFDQVKHVTDDERDAAWKRIRAAAKKFGVHLNEESWRDVGKTSSKS